VQTGLADSRKQPQYATLVSGFSFIEEAVPALGKELSSCNYKVKLSSCEYEVKWSFLQHAHLGCGLRNQLCKDVT